MWEFHQYWGSLGCFWASLFHLLILVLIVYIIWSLLQRGTKSPTCKNKETPMEILKRRYASGEINAEDFARIKKDLESNEWGKD